jgi:hypothetical protein
MKQYFKLMCFAFTLLFFCGNVSASQGCSTLNKCSTPMMQYDDGTLSLDDIATLPENTVFLGGSLTNKANRRIPVLLLSRNGGHNWEQCAFGFEGSGIANIQTYGIANVWAIISFQQEGAHNPEYLLRSVDAGKTWCVVSLTFIDIKDPLIRLKDLIFYDDLHGMMFISGSLGSSGAYYTKDGGISWNRLWKAQRNASAEVDEVYRYPDFTPPPDHAPLWTKQHDFYKITGLLRFGKKGDDYVFESYNYTSGKDWKVVSKVLKYQKADSKRFKRRSEMCPNKGE